MTYLDDVRDESARADMAYEYWSNKGRVPRNIEARRDAARRSLHYLEGPTDPCRCPVCRTSAV